MIKTTNIFALALIAILALCPQAPRAEPPDHAEDSAQADVDRKQAVIDRKIYVDPAPAKFKARGKGPLAEMKLILEKSKIRRGTPIRYRFEIKSVGTEPYLFGEFTQSFFKTGRLPSSAIRMHYKSPSGRLGSASSAYLSRSDVVMDEVQFPSGLKEEEKAAYITNMRREKNAAATMLQKLEPGEILHTVGDAPGDRFRTLNVDTKFDENGTYELFIVFQAFSKYENKSNHVKLTIVP